MVHSPGAVWTLNEKSADAMGMVTAARREMKASIILGAMKTMKR